MNNNENQFINQYEINEQRKKERRRNFLGILSALNMYFIVPFVVIFGLIWLLVGGLSGESKHFLILIICILYVVISSIISVKLLLNSRKK